MITPYACSIVVTYQCDSHIIERLKALLTQVQRVYVIDNGSEATILARLRELAARHPDISLTINTSNLGIAAAQNQGIRQALTDGFDWVLLQDDDSLPDANMVQTMLRAWKQHNDTSVGILAPRLAEQNVSVASRHLVPWHRIGFSRKTILPGQCLTDVVTVIASGSMIRADVFHKAGLMTEGYFIDYVDHEFCLRAQTHGYRIMVVGDAVLYHRQGNKNRQSLMGMSIVTQNYNAQRYYYIFRNRLFFLRRYGRRYPFLITHETMAYVWDMLRIIGCETNKLEKLRAMFRGLTNGIRQPVPDINR